MLKHCSQEQSLNLESTHTRNNVPVKTERSLIKRFHHEPSLLEFRLHTRAVKLSLLDKPSQKVMTYINVNVLSIGLDYGVSPHSKRTAVVVNTWMHGPP